MTKLKREVKAIANKIKEIWQEKDTLNSWIQVIWLLRKQLDEIEEAKFTGDAVLKEAADILIILIRYLDKIGIDVVKLVNWRLESRHRGKINEILAKYANIFEKEQEERLHER